MATLVVCLDGTNQTKTQPHPTNIARIFDSLGGQVVDGGHGSLETTVGEPATTGKYLPGVGTQGALALKIMGNLFGDGIAEPIIRGYTYLSRVWNPGDKIILTGFSRGATAARALAGLVVKQGLLNRARYTAEDKDAAYLRAVAAWYAYRKEKPTFASQARLVAIEGLLGHGLPTLSAEDFTSPVRISAVAVFDTVSSLGAPHLDASGQAVFDFSICDTTLSDAVDWGFHALAADEMRDLFAPTFWAARNQVVQQIFPGGHSDVGGGYPHRGLSDAALAWMFKNLASVGVVCDAGKLKPALADDPKAIAQDDGATFPFKDTPRRARVMPDSAVRSDTLVRRYGQSVQMLPASQAEPYKPKATWADGRTLF